MSGWVSVDTVHVSVKYPSADVFRRWARWAEGVDFRALKVGVPAEDAVVRSGGSGYKLSVWRHDARAYLTDYVDEKVGAGGMGIWAQFGPKYLLSHSESLVVAVVRFLESIGVDCDWPMRITRLDLAVDLPDVEMSDQDVEMWRRGWVGRSRVSKVYFDSQSGALQAVYVGARGSAVFLRVYDKVAQAERDGDLGWWRDVWDGYGGPVCRVEWEAKPSEGGFEGVADFEQYKQAELIGLAKYLLLWGRLCTPSESDTNNRRWALSEFWLKVQKAVEEWSEGACCMAFRNGKGFMGVNEQYVRFLSGAMSGGMARLGTESPTLVGLLDGLESHGQPLAAIQKKAQRKADVFSRLNGVQRDAGGDAKGAGAQPT